jgi:hypothetical protein
MSFPIPVVQRQESKGVGIKDVQAQLDHASAKVTFVVNSHLTPDLRSRQAEVFDAIFGGSKMVAANPWAGDGPMPTHASNGVPDASETESNVVAIPAPKITA